jgi:hypothetical protein
MGKDRDDSVVGIGLWHPLSQVRVHSLNLHTAASSELVRSLKALLCHVYGDHIMTLLGEPNGVSPLSLGKTQHATLRLKSVCNFPQKVVRLFTICKFLFLIPLIPKLP